MCVTAKTKMNYSAILSIGNLVEYVGFVQGIEWVNGEGADFTISCGKVEKFISLTHEEQSAMQAIMGSLNLNITNSNEG